jgi:hyperpolarization activated cyclic nucleotide-gated potassium channel 2
MDLPNRSRSRTPSPKSLNSAVMPPMNADLDDFIDAPVSCVNSHISKKSTMTVEDQLRAKFLNAGSATESAPAKKQTKFADAVRKVNMNMDSTQVRICDSDESSDSLEIANRPKAYSKISQRKSRKSEWARRPSVNPALLNLSSSEEESDQGDDDSMPGYVAQRYSWHAASSSESENSDEERVSKQFRKTLRKTIVEHRKTLRNIRDSKVSMDIEREESEIQQSNSASKRKFKSAVHGVNFTKRLSTAARSSIKDPFVRDRTGSITVDITKMEFPRRRQAIDAQAEGENVDMREQMAQVAAMAKESEKWVINPFSKFRFNWDILTVFVILCNVITLPLEFSIFDNRTELDGIKIFSDIWFMIDIMLNFRTGTVVGNGRSTVNMNPADIRKEYMRSWFAIDLLATVPFDVLITMWISSDDEVTENVESIAKVISITRTLKILKLLRLLRLGRFVRYLHRWEEILSMDYGTGENLIKGISWILTMMLMCHWNACVLFLVPTVSTKGRPPNGTNFSPRESYEHSWFYGSDILSKSTYQQYAWCLFKSMSHMLTIGYGVNTPHVMSDLWTSIFVMFTGALTFALFLSQIISIVDQMKISGTRFKRHVQEVDDYLKFNRCPPNLKKAVKEYYAYHYRQRIFDQEAILNELNPILLEELTTCGILEYIQGCELFRSCRLDFQHELCKLFRVEMYQPYTDIVLSGRSARTFYIIRQGVVTADSDNARRGHEYNLEEGDSFGLEAFSDISNPRYVTTVSTDTWVEVLQMDVAHFHELVHKCPEYRDTVNIIRSIANQQLRTSGLLAQVALRQKEIRRTYGN